jgi:type I restriction enzyme, S subunit
MTDTIIKSFDIWATTQAIKSSGRVNSVDNQKYYGIQKLRELILGISLRGLFQGKNEALPDSINQDITRAKAIYYKSIGRKLKEFSFGPALLDEFSLPSGWMWKRIGELCDLQTGATPSTQKKEYFNGNIRWLVSGDINQGIIEDCEGRISEEGLANSNCKILPSNTVLIALNGQGKTRATVALLKVPAACNQSLVGMIPFDSTILDPTFLLLFLRYRYYEIRDITGQKQRRGLNMGLVSELSVPLPPLSDQHRIVAKVFELMAFCDNLEQKQTGNNIAHQTLVETLLSTLTSAANPAEFKGAWQRITNHFDTLFTTEYSIDQLEQTILQLAVMGKIVPQNTSDEPASELLKKIATAQKRLVKEEKIKKREELPEIREEEKPFMLPKGWEWSRLGLIGLGSTGKTPSTNILKYFGGNIPFIGPGQITTSGEILDSDKTLTEEGSKYSTIAERGDIVMVCIGGSIGKSAIIKSKVAFNQQINCLHPLLIDIYYLNLVLNTSYFKEAILNKATGSATPIINRSKWEEIPLPIPPQTEQNRIVAKVDDLFALCDALKGRIAQSQDIQFKLANTVVEQAII